MNRKLEKFLRQFIRFFSVGLVLFLLLMAMLTSAHKNYMINLPTERVQR